MFVHNLFYQSFLAHFGLVPTKNQRLVIGEITDFVMLNLPKSTYLLRGYAGTGKTSIVGALVKTLPEFKLNAVLLAPTGRAAKVLSGYSKQPAFTIHKMIYQLKSGNDGYTRFQIKENKFQNVLFIVDEASMLGLESGTPSNTWGNQRSLLDDLLTFVFSGKNCKLMLIGDEAQLPPVGADSSPALDEDFLHQTYSLNLSGNVLTEVVRQEKKSGILRLATELRTKNESKNIEFPLFSLKKSEKDVRVISGVELEDELNSTYDKFGQENVMVICRSNKRANLFNLQIRARIKWLDEEIATGDYMMVVKNNYFWLDDSSKAGFIANGDIVEILKIRGEEECYGFRFITAIIRMIDYPDEKDLEVKILMESILAESPSLPQDKFKELYEAIAEEYMYEPNKKKRNELIRKNPYYQAVQVKFAYAVTCHKSQGGQWDVVFVEQGYLSEEMINAEYVRWLYTAVTRAKKQLYLVNFNEELFS